MEWSRESQALKKELKDKIPFFVRGFVEKTVTKAAESIASERKAKVVELSDVVKAYLTTTPRAMQGPLVRAMREKGIDPESYGFSGWTEEKGFPVAESMTDAEAQDFLRHAVTGHLGTCAGGVPYVVPLSYVYLNGKVYLHWFRQEGRKVKNLQDNPRVCFEVDEYTRDHLNSKSVIAEGAVTRVTDKDEKAQVMKAFTDKFPEYAVEAGHDPEVQGIIEKGLEAMVEAVEIHRIEIESLTGRKKGAM